MAASYPLPREQTRGLAYYARVVRVVSGIEFKLKYAGSAMGYVWSLAKPLAYFGILLLVFGHLLKTGNQTRDYPLFLLIGILLYTFLVETISTMLPSIVGSGGILRRLHFPPLLLPLSVSVAACLTFLLNMLAVVVYVAIERITPEPGWLLIVPLLAELYLFIIGVGLVLAALNVRFRDISQIWELVSQILIFATPIFYPVGILPVWAQRLDFLNPLVQVLQDVRHVVLGGTSGPYDRTAAVVLSGIGGRLPPVALAVVVFAAGLVLFKREARYFAERV